MKKRTIFLVLLVLIFFACDFNMPTMPTAVEVIGSPSVRFAGKVNMGKMFTDMLDSEFDRDEMEGMTIFPCENTKDFTFLIYMELFNEEFNIEIINNIIDEDASTIPDFPGIDKDGLKNFLEDLFKDKDWDKEITLDDDIELIKSDAPMTLPLSNIGSLLEGFTFSEYEIKLYFSGSEDIIKKSQIYIGITESDTATEPEYINYTPENKSSGYENDSWENGYTAAILPEGGEDITFPMNGKDIDVYYKIIIPEGEELGLSDFKNGNIKVEVVIWLPFVFEAASEAEIVFPDDSLFSSKDDLFGRDEPDAENMMTKIIESLSLEIVFDNNPFKGSELIVWSGDNIEIINPLIDNSFPFVISEENMKKINSPENWPFTPNFKMRFPQGATLRFPREFNAVGFIFKPKIKYRMDF